MERAFKACHLEGAPVGGRATVEREHRVMNVSIHGNVYRVKNEGELVLLLGALMALELLATRRAA